MTEPITSLVGGKQQPPLSTSASTGNVVDAALRLGGSQYGVRLRSDARVAQAVLSTPPRPKWDLRGLGGSGGDEMKKNERLLRRLQQQQRTAAGRLIGHSVADAERRSDEIASLRQEIVLIKSHQHADIQRAVEQRDKALAEAEAQAHRATKRLRAENERLSSSLQTAAAKIGQLEGRLRSKAQRVDRLEKDVAFLSAEGAERQVGLLRDQVRAQDHVIIQLQKKLSKREEELADVTRQQQVAATVSHDLVRRASFYDGTSGDGNSPAPLLLGRHLKANTAARVVASFTSILSEEKRRANAAENKLKEVRKQMNCFYVDHAPGEWSVPGGAAFGTTGNNKQVSVTSSRVWKKAGKRLNLFKRLYHQDDSGDDDSEEDSGSDDDDEEEGAAIFTAPPVKVHCLQDRLEMLRLGVKVKTVMAHWALDMKRVARDELSVHQDVSGNAYRKRAAHCWTEALMSVAKHELSGS